MAFNPTTHSLTAKAMGFSQATPSDARSYFFDTDNFVYRPYVSTSEVLSYLNLSKYRTGNFSIYVNSTGILNGDGTITGGSIVEYWFKDGTADVNLVLKSSGGAVQISFTTAVPFNAGMSVMNTDVSGPLAFTVNTTGAVAGNGALLRIKGNGVNTPTFSAPFIARPSSQAWSATANMVHEVVFLFNGVEYTYSITQIAVSDTTAPTLTGIAVADSTPTIVDFTFNEALAPGFVPLYSDFAITGHTTTGTVTISGAVAHVPVTAAFTYGETARTASYTPGLTANKLQDAAGNLVAAFSSQAITNNVAPPDTTAPTLVSATVANSTPTQVDLVFSEAMNATWSAYTAFGVTGHTVTAITRLTATTGYLTVSAAFTGGETARTLSYTQPGSNKMQDLAGNLLANIASASITNNVVAASDADAAAFLTHYGITNGTIVTAIDNLVIARKAAGLWTKDIDLYPIVGGSTGTVIGNLKQPGVRDLILVGSPTITANHIAFNGTSQYARTGVVPTTHGMSCMTMYIRNNPGANNGYDMGASDTLGPGGSHEMGMIARYTGDAAVGMYGTDTYALTASSTDSRGHWAVFRSPSINSRLARNGSEIATPVNDFTARPSYEIYVGANNGAGTAHNFSDKQVAFIGFSTMDETDIANDYTTVQAFQTALSR